MTRPEADLRGYRLDVYRDPEDGNWVAEVPDLPGCIAAAGTPAAAVRMAEDAISAWIDAAVADGRPVPEPTREEGYSGRFVLRVARSLHRQLARQARREGVSLNAYCATALARAVGASQASTVTVFDAHDYLRTYQEFAIAVGDYNSTGSFIVGDSPAFTRSAAQSSVWSMSPENAKTTLGPMRRGAA